MECTMPFELVAADMLHECPVLCEKLGLDGLARLATCSKALKTTIETVLVKDSLNLLDRAVDTTRQTEQQQKQEMVAWLATNLLRKAPALAVDVSERLIHLPSVLLATAKQLVKVGVRITCVQLLAAANSMVAGVEVWVQAQRELGIQTDIPALAVTICCDDDWVSSGSTNSATRHSQAGCRSELLPAGLQHLGFTCSTRQPMICT
jgi:hypothetical protein